MSDQSLQQLLVTNFGLLPSGYTGSQGAIGYTGSAGTGGGGGSGPTISAVQVIDVSGTVLDDTAVDIAGGRIRLTGTGFESGCQVIVNNIPATSTTFVSATQVTAQVPATAAGTYIVYLVNTSGSVAIRVNGITFSATPAWSTGSTLPAGDADVAVSIQLAAAGASTYSLAAGSSLPGTLALSSSGLLSGTVSGLTNETTYSFTVLATDAELQDSPRTFSITITAGDALFPATTLLLPGSVNTFIKDASTNNFTATVVGDAKPSSFNPHLTGWSNFFDGSGDYLRVPSTGAGFSSITTFTYECWIQPTSALSTNCIFDISETQPFRFVLTGSNVTWQASNSGATILTATFTWVIGAWHHVAFVRDSSNNISIFINGTRYATANFGGNWGATQAGGVNIGCNRGDTWFFPGYISNARFVKGTAIYDPTQTTITVPTTPLTAVAGTSLLTCADNRFIDDSVDNLAVTVNGEVKVQSFSPFVEPTTTRGSAYFAGGTSYITAPVTASTGDLTIECWIYPTAYTSPRAFVFTSGGNDATAWAISYGTNSVVSAWIGSYGGPSVASTNTVPLNTWGHIAIVKTAGTVYMYVNGIRSTGVSQAGTFGSATNVHIATYNGGINSQSFAGYVSNFRYVDGTALYTGANITPPASPLTAVSGTRLLTLQTNTPVSNNTFLDSSSNNLLITRSGNATQGTFSPYSPSGWSNHFSANTAYLTVASNAAFAFPGAFTVEGWFNWSTLPSAGQALGVLAAGGFNFTYGSGSLSFNNFGSGNIATATYTFVVGVWYHIAMTRNVSNTCTIWINGVSSATGSSAVSFAQGTWSIYGGSNNGGAGYASNLRVVKGTAVYTANFTPPTQPLTAIPGTSLLTCADNRFVDDSANNFAITRTGDVRVQNFSPFRAVVQTPASYSAYFDGVGTYLSVPDSDVFALGSSNFTMECWIHPTATSANFPTIAAQYGGSFFWSLDTLSIVFYLYSPGATLLSVSNAVVLNTWSHHAVVRNANTLTYYINGTSVATIAFTGSVTDSTKLLTIGNSGEGTGYTSYPFTGYISNFRLVKGTAVYTANFTPSTTPLTAIANTSLLTCQNPTFVDNSTNRFAITTAGNSQPSMVNPFGSTFVNSTGYTAAEYGGSMSFDGTGDYLTFNASNISNDNWTIEGWVYFNNFSTTNPYVWSWGGGNSNYFGLYRNSTAGKLYFTSGISGNYTNLISTTTIQAGSWYHTAIVKLGGTCSLYVNGIKEASASTSLTDNIEVTVGYEKFNNNANNYLNGYISGLRVIRGTALYTSSFAPPVAPALPVQNTTLLLNGTAAAITDATTKTVLETVGDARISTVQSKFGGSSMFFDGSGDLLQTNNNTELYGAGLRFTAECWIYVTNTGITSGIMACWNPTTGHTGWSITCTDKIKLTFGSQFFNSTWEYNNLGSISANTWTHIAFVRTQSGTDNVNSFFINGVSVLNAVDSLGTTRYTGSPANGNPFAIGGAPSISSSRFTSTIVPMNGYIQDVRITQGTARYTANFTPPASAFQTR